MAFFRVFTSALLTGIVTFAASPVADRVGSTAFIQVEAESFNKLQPKQQALAYWLSQASIAIDPIIYDQQSRFGLRQKALLEAVMAAKAKVDPVVYAKVADFTKLFWANKGNRSEMTAQKFLPTFTPEEMKTALRQAGKANLLPEVEALNQSLFDPAFEPLLIAKSPKDGMDILQASGNNFYSNVTMADLKGFAEQYPFNSRLVKENGTLVEQVYRAGTPDGKIPAGLYAQYLKRACLYLAKAQAYAEPDQARLLGKLILYYQTGNFQDWIDFGSLWVLNNPAVDFVNGFVEVYRDARGAKGSAQSFVSVTDEALTTAMRKLATNAQYFEDRAPWDAAYKKQGLNPPIVKAVETVIETADFHVSTIGDNLPNEAVIREKIGTKSFLITSSSKAIEGAQGASMNAEFSSNPEEEARGAKYGQTASSLLVAMHEVIGHGSGKLAAKVNQKPEGFLKEYFSTMEEARADLMAYWNIFDPKLKELDLVVSDEVGKALYDSAARTMFVQLRRVPQGDTIEEDHQRGRQLIARYIMDKTGAIAVERKGDKTFVVVKDYNKMREGVGMLLAELMRIKAEGDYDAIRKLIEQYGVHFDTKMRDEAVARYATLNLPTFWAGINPDLTARLDAKGSVTKVTMTYPRDIVAQQLRYSAMHK